MIYNVNKSSGTSTTTSPLTWSHTCLSNDKVLVVGTGVAAPKSSQTVTAVTYNGVSMTQIGTALDNVSAGFNISLWYLENPTVGVNTVSATFSSVSHTNGIALSFPLASTYDTTATNTTNTTSISTSLTPTNSIGSFIVDVIANAATSATITDNGRQTIVSNNVSVGIGGAIMAMSVAPQFVRETPIKFDYTLAGTGPDTAHRMASFAITNFSTPTVKNPVLRPAAFTPGFGR